MKPLFKNFIEYLERYEEKSLWDKFLDIGSLIVAGVMVGLIIMAAKGLLQ